MFYYIKQHLNTQLKTVGESVSVVSKLEETLKEIDNISTVGMPRMAQANNLLKETFANCSIEATKMAIAQSTLNEDQIALILSSKGLTGNILETTTAELANATATNAVAVAEGTATTATVGFGTAIKGLGASLKSLAAAHPVLLAITAAIGAIYAAVKIVDACTTTFDELKDKISDLKQEVSDSESTLKDYKTQLDEINQKITEINSQDSLSLTDEQELENLKNQKTELENLYEIEKARHDLKQKELEDTANKYFDKTFSSKYKTDSYTQKQMKNGQLVDVSYSKSKQVTKLEEMKAASDQMLKKQKELDLLNARYNNNSDPTDKETKEYEKKKAQLEKARDDAKKTALDIQEEAKNQIEGLDSTSDTYKKVTEASQELSDSLARLNNDWDSLSSKGKQEDLSSKISKDIQNSISNGLADEYDKISDWGLDDYADKIEDGSIQSKFGNVDMDKRTIIHWSDELKKTYADALASWDYDPEIGSIDTVFGGSERFGEDLNGSGWEVAFTPILPDGTFLSKDTVEEYINSILAEAYADDGKVTEDELTAIDAEGRQIGDTFVKGIFAGIDDSQDYDDNGNWADVVGRLMHFSGKNGAVQILKNNQNSSSDNMSAIKDYLSTLSDDDLNILANVTFDENTTVESLKEAIKAAQEEANKSSVDLSVKTFDPTSLLEESDDKTKTATLADLQSEADLLSSIQKKMSETGRIGVDSMQKIIKQYPEAKDALGQYMLGIISQEELFAELEGVYEDDKDAYIKSVVEKAKTDEDFFNTLKTNYPELINQLGAVYGTDVANWTTMEQAKVNITAQAIQQIANIYKEFYKAMGVNDGIDFNIQATKNAISAGNPGAIGGSLFSKSYSKSNFDKVVTDNNHKFKMNGNDVSNVYKELQNNIDSVWNTAEKMKNAIDDAAYNQINASIDTSWQGLGGSDSSSSSQTAEKLNWIERLINKISTAYSRLKNIVSDTTTTWLKRNNALSDSMSTLSSEINAQKQAYEYYMNAFSSYDLDDYYKNQIADGSISIDVIYDDDLKDAISDCQDFYDKAQDCKDAVESLSQEYRELAMTKFNNIKSQFEEQISLIENTTSELQKMQDILSTQGYTNSKFLYGSLIKTEKENLEKLNAEYTALASKIGTVEEGSENWYSMQADINSVSEAILDATNSLREYENELRKIEWDAFDRGRDDVADLIDETEFLYNLLENKGLYDDSGNLNEYGQAAQAMTAQKYQLYASQAKAYADEINKINEELAKDPYNTTLIDRKQELIKLQQESIKSALDEKNAIKDLISNGFEEYTKSLNEIIDKYKDMMSTIKDAYDYEKSIAEQTKNIALLEKQYTAYQGDDSEGSKKTIQEIKANLESAKDDLKETEYEKLISDTEKLLDDLQDSTEEWLNQRLDDLDALIENVINQSNENAGSVSETIANVAKETGYTLSDNMNSIWSTYSGNLVNALGNASDVFTNNQSKLQSVVENIGDKVQKLLDYADAEAARLQAEQEAREEAAREEAARQEAADTDNSWSGSDYDGDSGDSSSGGSGGVDWIYSPDYYPKDQLNIETSIVDRLKWHDWDSSFSARSQYYDQMGGDGNYYATYDQNVWMLDWMKANRFAKGSRNIPKNQIALTQEKGQELIFNKLKGTMLTPLGKGDMVFTKEMSENLWKLAQNPIAPNMSVPDVKNVVNRNLSNNVKVEFGDVAVTLPNVQNYQDFCRQAQKDPKFEKMVQNMALGQAFGKNGFDKYVY